MKIFFARFYSRPEFFDREIFSLKISGRDFFCDIVLKQHYLPIEASGEAKIGFEVCCVNTIRENPERDFRVEIFLLVFWAAGASDHRS